VGLWRDPPEGLEHERHERRGRRLLGLVPRVLAPDGVGCRSAVLGRASGAIRCGFRRGTSDSDVNVGATTLRIDERDIETSVLDR